jgi:hypothetical protein
MTWAHGGTEALSWAVALEEGEPHLAESRQLVAETNDAEIGAAVEARQLRDAVAEPLSASPGELLWDRLLVESRALPEQKSRVTVVVPPQARRRLGRPRSRPLMGTEGS